MVNRTRASREYLGPKEEAIRMRMKEAQTFAGQTASSRPRLALRSASSKTNSLTYESDGSDSSNDEDPLARQRRLGRAVSAQANRQV